MSLEKVSISPRLIPSTRFTLSLLVSFALFIQYAQRVSLSMAIVCMVNKTDINLSSETTTTLNKYGSQFLEERQFFLTEFQQQILLGAHWFGYLLSLTPGRQTKHDKISKIFPLIQVVGYQSKSGLNERSFPVFF
jgi:hypothetical protein